jgi:penicillin amidase
VLCSIATLVLGAGCTPRVKWPASAPLTAPVEIETDAYGVPHVRAANLPDLYFAWGWVTARDRSWQLILTRAQTQGLSHRFLGDAALRGDGGAQLFRLRERAAAIWQRDRQDPELRVAIERYTDGINSWLQARGEQATPRGEFAALKLHPEPWKPEDTYALLLGYGVTLDLSLPELSEARQIREHGAGWIENRRRFESQWIFDTIPDSATGAVPALGPRENTRVAAAAPQPSPGQRANANVAAPPPAPGPRANANIAAPLPASLLAAARDAALAYPARAADGSDRASNAFAVGPRRTVSGMPILANDPHLHLSTPGPFHMLHLFIPGVLDVAGAAAPGLPCVISGRNENCAWGITAVGSDLIDVYADTLSADGRRVRWQGGWAPVTSAPYDLSVHRAGIAFAIPAFMQKRRWTPHGPVVGWDPKHHLALAARWSAMEDDRISIRDMVGLERSRTAEEVARRFRTMMTPAFNCVTADDEGHVIYQATGLTPVRPFPFSYGPLPSDGKHEWAGFVPMDSMPAWRVPANGYVVNGNNRPRNLPGWDRYDWVHDRAGRMSELLGESKKLDMNGAAEIQNDLYSRAGARSTPPLLAAADSLADRLGERERKALALLRPWGYTAQHDRVAPTLNRSWWSALVRHLGTEGLPGLTLAALRGEAPDALAKNGGAPERPAEAALSALGMALDTLTAKLGPDQFTWEWGRAHRAYFEHGLGVREGLDWSAERIAEDGDGSTIAVAGTYVPWSFDVTHGPGFRHIVDLAVPESSLAVIPPWNSDAFRLDQRPRWAEHRYFPLLRDWKRIEERAIDHVTLGTKTK